MYMRTVSVLWSETLRIQWMRCTQGKVSGVYLRGLGGTVRKGRLSDVTVPRPHLVHQKDRI